MFLKAFVQQAARQGSRVPRKLHDEMRSPEGAKESVTVGDGLDRREIRIVERRVAVRHPEWRSLRITFKFAAHEARSVPTIDHGFGAQQRRVNPLGGCLIAAEYPDLRHQPGRI